MQVLIPVFLGNLCVLLKVRIKNNWQNLVATLNIRVFVISLKGFKQSYIQDKNINTYIVKPLPIMYI